MSDEMVWSLVRQRQAEGASDEQIKRELTAMGISEPNTDVLLAEPPPNWDAALFWVQLSPLVLVPMIAVILSLVLTRPQLAFAMIVIGFLTYMLAALAMLVMGFTEHVLWGIALFLFWPLASIAFTVCHIDRTWKLALTYMVGCAVALTGAYMEPEIVKQLFHSGH